MYSGSVVASPRILFYLGICDLTVNLFSRIGPEKGVIHLATAAVNNALWDMFARARGKPLWKLIVDMTPVRDIVYDCPFQIHYEHMHRKS
jgi:L-alanine-DL-glutamate epimerase-like enolase superfamily enzyme